MSNSSTLYINDDGEMITYCPVCGEYIEVDEVDYHATLEDGTKEYYLECLEEDCGCTFYCNVNY